MGRRKTVCCGERSRWSQSQRSSALWFKTDHELYGAYSNC
ncbi:unnamed protein product [Gongylonema pulchrum]|uniref:Uncharacterized protein n=1 Tax=Gongylonema pulchrum TaxID=637853 RepID=A0A3P6SC84_9BILA|nr:unnamed protein product [Gongylonema pulchrum]